MKFDDINDIIKVRLAFPEKMIMSSFFKGL